MRRRRHSLRRRLAIQTLTTAHGTSHHRNRFVRRRHHCPDGNDMPRRLAASPTRHLSPIRLSQPRHLQPGPRPPSNARAPSAPAALERPTWLALNPARHALSVPALRRSHPLRRLRLEICGARTSCGDSTPVPAAPAPPAASAHAPQCLRRSRTPCGACTSMPAAFAPPAAPAQPYLRRSHPLRRLHQSSQRGEQSGRALPA